MKNVLDCSIRACCLCDIAISAHTCTTFRHVLSKHSIIIGIRPSFQCLLCSLLVLLLAEPCHNARLLERLAIREREMPRHFGLEQLVHCAEIDGGHFFVILVKC